MLVVDFDYDKITWGGNINYHFFPKVQGDKVILFEWDFGDNKSSFEVEPKHFYSKKGKYDVKLTVTTTSNEEASINKKIEVGSDFKVPDLSYLEDNEKDKAKRNSQQESPKIKSSTIFIFIVCLLLFAIIIVVAFPGFSEFLNNSVVRSLIVFFILIFTIIGFLKRK